MYRYLKIVPALLLLCSCSQPEPFREPNVHALDSIDKAQREQALLADSIRLADSMRRADSIARARIPHDTLFRDSIYPVFEFNQRCWGLVIDNPHEHVFDSIVERIAMEDSLGMSVGVHPPVPVDSSSHLRFYKSARLEEFMRNHIPAALFVCGDRGIQQVHVSRVLLIEEPCVEYAVLLCFEGLPENSIGHPLWASTKKIELTYSPDPSAEKVINHAGFLRGRSDDPTKYHVYAQKDSLRFAFADDFTWPNHRKDPCIYPERVTFVVRNGKYIEKRVDGIDLHGDACD